jgi:hypothetical protein
MKHVDHEVALLEIVLEILALGKGQGLSNAEVARRADLSPTSLCRLKSLGRADFRTIHRLAEVVGYDISVRPKVGKDTP